VQLAAAGERLEQLDAVDIGSRWIDDEQVDAADLVPGSTAP
jgi:hypothetical protein